MTRIHLFRHGQTQWNLQKKLQGHEDSPLTELGIAQAQEAKSKLKGVRMDSVWSSPSGRAMQTASLLADVELNQVKTMEGFREINLGSWEGQSTDYINVIDNKRYTDFWNHPDRYVPDTGESFEQVRVRGLQALEDLAQECSGQTVVLVSHAGWIKTVITALLNKAPTDIWQEPFAHNLSESILCYENGNWRVEKFCDITWNK
ncbi:histidine phosphatase family protein [Vibrio sp. S9_S30]|uniref:histidine phosphatase family protein n=1 Tax=Vibrio sp. S9_S30 TaxID=2720226 RepID=UPI001681B944|nr:histidine phosphatase family protein [Vibrio sp. S9_S30]